MPPIICHCLIGPPGSGKSTLAQQWLLRYPSYVWVSTDQVREQLYGNPAHQGHWPDIDAAVEKQITEALADQRPVIYDATNTCRSWRLGFLQKFATPDTLWLGWHLTTPMELCLARNQQRARQVPPTVIQRAYETLKLVKPDEMEGFALVSPVPLCKGEFDLDEIKRLIDKTLPKAIAQRQRRYGKTEWHNYSTLLPFEQLIYLIALLLKYPGAGYLHLKGSDLLKDLLGVDALPSFASPIEELSALLTKQHGDVYGDQSAVARNLQWLLDNQIINSPYTPAPLEVPDIDGPLPLAAHRYSDLQNFERLIQTIRFIAHHPFLHQPGEKVSETLAQAMAQEGIVGFSPDTIRRDIQEVLKPYGIMTDSNLRQGYFVGTAILGKTELWQLFENFAQQVNTLNDPLALDLYKSVQKRLQYVQLDTPDRYPVRTMLSKPIVDVNCLPSNCLAHPSALDSAETAIVEGKYLRLRRLKGSGRHFHDQDEPFDALPLRIIFHRIGWYLAYQRCSDGLLKFERLDRLTGAHFSTAKLPKAPQKEALQQIERLYKSGFSLFIGNDPTEQQTFLSKDKKERAQVEGTLELWIDDAKFRFISEGTQRFQRLHMSPKPDISVNQVAKDIFCLEPTGNARFPHRLQATLPIWVLRDDFELQSWIMGFGGHVRVVQPESLAAKLKAQAQAIVDAYS
jgi:predicted kinase